MILGSDLSQGPYHDTTYMRIEGALRCTLVSIHCPLVKFHLKTNSRQQMSRSWDMVWSPLLLDEPILWWTKDVTPPYKLRHTV